MEGGERDEPFLAGFGLGGSSEGGAEILTAAEEGRAKKDMSPWAMLDGAAATATMAGGRRSGERETLGERRAGRCLEAVAEDSEFRKRDDTLPRVEFDRVWRHRLTRQYEFENL